ncbi:sensor domain-containing diguanylate cyclase [Spiribacter insolitus]|uniref:diguanylate cyclase n=1 Tax=Spiribacter insolitus TaxID=3122417 RepID=A0ABV3T607_9GAMM
MESLSDQSVLARLVEQVYDSVLVTETQLAAPGPRIVYANRAFCRKTGYSLEELIGETPRILQGPATDRTVLQRLRQQLLAGEAFEGSTVNYRKNGEPYIVRWSISRLEDAETGQDFYVSVQREITHEIELEHANRRILESISEGIVGIDPAGRVTLMNPAAERMLEIDRGRLLCEKTWEQWLDPLRRARIERPLDAVMIVEEVDLLERIRGVMRTGVPLADQRVTVRHSDGSTIHLEVSAKAMSIGHGESMGAVIILRDRTEQRVFERELWQAANHDPLTGAHNRRFADDILAREIRRADTGPHPLALILFDLDHFKAINDEFGHHVGDKVLKSVVKSVRSRLRASDYLVRWGGEEFALILPDTDRRGAVSVAESLRRQVERTPIGRDLDPVRISLGVSQYRMGEGLRAWFRRVDDALYQAKSNGRNRVEAA